MTRRPFLSRWVHSLLTLFTVVSALASVALFPITVQAQSGITTPTSGTTVAGDVIIIGTAVHPAFQRYELYYKLEPSSNDAYVYFDGGNAQVTNGPLGIWRTTGLPPGAYSIRLRVVKNDSNYDEVVLGNVLIGQAALEPTPTPTSSEPTPTPIPTATFTPAPQPTPIVGQVTQPEVENDGPLLAPTPIPDAVILTGTMNSSNSVGGENSGSLLTGVDSASAPQEVSSSFTRELGEAVAVDRLRGFFFTGMRVSAILILGSIVLLAGRRLLGWVWTQYR